jgi:hypothetical protein
MAALTSAMAVSSSPAALLQKSTGNALQSSFQGVAVRVNAGTAVRVARKGLAVVAMARKPPVVEKDENEADQRLRLNDSSHLSQIDKLG